MTLDEALSSNMSSTFDLETDAGPSPMKEEEERPRHQHQGQPNQSDTHRSADWSGASSGPQYAQYAHGKTQPTTKKVEINLKDCDGIHIGHTFNNFYNCGTVPSSFGGMPQSQKKSKSPINIKNADKPVSDKDISAVSLKVGSKWRAFGRALGFSDGELENFYHDRIQEGLAEVNHCMISNWREKFGNDATRKAFAERMKSEGRFDLIKCLVEQNS